MHACSSRIFLAEDEWLIAAGYEVVLEEAGYEIIGPMATIAQAMEGLSDTIDAAILDVRLGAEPTFPIAQALIARGVPVLFVTGYTSADLPREFHHCTILQKPVAPESLLAALKRLLTASSGRVD